MSTKAEPIYSITTDEERLCLSQLAMEVHDGGLILEIGTLYGGTTAILAKSAPKCRVVSIDDYSWTPDGVQNTPEQVRAKLDKVGVKNVELYKGDSRTMWKDWIQPIDLLWIDGGHSFEYVYSDIFNFGKFAKVIALHDFDNPAWITIRKAVETFMAKNRIWYIANVTGQVVTLRKI